MDCRMHKAVFGILGDIPFGSWCATANPDATRSKATLCDDCQEAITSYGIIGEKPFKRWCSGCETADHPGAFRFFIMMNFWHWF